jgi:hypothetical protein
VSSRLLTVIAAALAVAGLLEALLAPGAEGERLVGAIAAPALAAQLAWGRRAPVTALAAIAAVLAVQAARGGTLAGSAVTTIAVLAVALYCAGRHAWGGRALAGAAGLAALIAATRVAADPAARSPRDALLTFAAVACRAGGRRPRAASCSRTRRPSSSPTASARSPPARRCWPRPSRAG